MAGFVNLILRAKYLPPNTIQLLPPDSFRKNFMPSMQELYARTVCKRDKLINLGYQYVQMWGCEWEDFKRSDRQCQEILQNYPQAPPMNIREALAGGRLVSVPGVGNVKSQ